jgi:hypothetical protein
VLRHVIQRGEAEKQGADPPPDWGPLLDMITSPYSTDKENSIVLTLLLSTLLKDADSRFLDEYGVRGAGTLVTTVIRAMKAWTKGLSSEGFDEGDGIITQITGLTGAGGLPYFLEVPPEDELPESLKQAGRTLRNARLPGYVWEVFVLYVLDMRLQQCRDEGRSAAVYSMHLGPLTLFLDVLLEAYLLMRPTARNQPPPEPIAVNYFYTPEQRDLFRGTWGPPGPLYTPYIIHPADPRFNCRLHTVFNRWDRLAHEAGLLCRKLRSHLQDKGGSQRNAGSTDNNRLDNVWQQAVHGTSLEHAVGASLPLRLEELAKLWSNAVSGKVSVSFLCCRVVHHHNLPCRRCIAKLPVRHCLADTHLLLHCSGCGVGCQCWYHLSNLKKLTMACQRSSSVCTTPLAAICDCIMAAWVMHARSGLVAYICL